MSDVPPSDFRDGMIEHRLESVKKILLVLSGKGGVGKSVVSAGLAAIFREAGCSVGLLDADIYGPSSALLYGARTRPAETEDGLVPPKKAGVSIMSVDFYAPGLPVPLTGAGAREVVKEMLALTWWGGLDFLVIDMPPATSDIMMEITSLHSAKVSAIVVTTPDRLSLAVAHRVLQLLDSAKVPTEGVLGNMYRRLPGGVEEDDRPKKMAEEFGVPFLGALPYDPGVRTAEEKNDIGAIVGTSFGDALRRSAKMLLRPGGKERQT